MSQNEIGREIVWKFGQLYHSLKHHNYCLLAHLEVIDLAIYNSINGDNTRSPAISPTQVA